MPPARVLVIGGGMAGLSAALALQAQGSTVHILERDAPPPDDLTPANSSAWHRPGAPHVRHTHYLLGPLRNLMREHYPDLVEKLLAAGVWEQPFQDTLHPVAKAGYRERPSDALITAFASRRTTLELVMRRYVQSLSNVLFEANAQVTGLLTAGDSQTPVQVTGVSVVADGQARTVEADLVIDASGRTSRLGEQLRALGLHMRDEQHDTGDLYYTRHYQLEPGHEYPSINGFYGIMTPEFMLGILPADNGVFTATIAVWKDDPLLCQALHNPTVYDAFFQLIPRMGRWIDPTRARPASEQVYGFGHLDSFWRTTAPEGNPQVLNLFFLGDAVIRTNPKFGRGCTWGFIQAHCLADILVTEPDPARRIVRYERELRKTFRASWEITQQLDIDRYRHFQALLGQRRLTAMERCKATLEDVIVRRGTLMDAHLQRAIMTGFHGLTEMTDWGKDPAVWLRTLKVLCSPRSRKLSDPIPTREQIRTAVATAQSAAVQY